LSCERMKDKILDFILFNSMFVHFFLNVLSINTLTIQQSLLLFPLQKWSAAFIKDTQLNLYTHHMEQNLCLSHYLLIY